LSENHSKISQLYTKIVGKLQQKLAIIDDEPELSKETRSTKKNTIKTTGFLKQNSASYCQHWSGARPSHRSILFYCNTLQNKENGHQQTLSSKGALHSRLPHWNTCAEALFQRVITISVQLLGLFELFCYKAASFGFNISFFEHRSTMSVFHKFAVFNSIGIF